MYRYLLLLIVSIFLFSCDDRNPSEPDYVFEEVFTEYFDQLGNWELEVDFSSVLGDTAWALVDDGQLKLGALYGWNVPSAEAYHNFADSLAQLWSEKNILIEIKIINSGISSVGNINCNVFFVNDLVSINFDSYGLFDYSNYILQIDYEREYNWIKLRVNGVQLASYQINGPGELDQILFSLWTSSANGSGSALLNIDHLKVFTYWEED